MLSKHLSFGSFYPKRVTSFSFHFFVIKYHYQKQLEDERVHIILQFVIH